MRTGKVGQRIIDRFHPPSIIQCSVHRLQKITRSFLHGLMLLMRYGLFSPRPASNVCVSNEYDENMWIMTPMFCLLCYDSGLVMAMAVLWSGPWLAAATSPGQWFRGGRKKSGSDDSKQLNRPVPAPASALPLLLLGVRSDPAVIVEISTVQIDF